MRVFLFVLSIGFFCVTSLRAKDYKGAELRTKDSYLYGRFEVRMKPAAGTGFLSSFFTYHDFQSDVSEWNEIDFEILGRYNQNIQMTSIGPGQTIRPSHQWVDYNPHLSFHTYTIEWTPDYIAWFVDGREFHRQNEAFVHDFHYPQKIMMNLWNSEWDNWVGPWFDANLPVFSYYDYVSYAAYTPGQGNCGTNNNFTLRWIDHFDSLNTARWDRATHTFYGNKCDFTPQNIVFKDGKMILCLTDAEHLGFVDRVAPSMLYAWAIDSTFYLRFSENLDIASANDRTHYRIPGLEIKSAHLLTDHQTVVLYTTSPQEGQNYNVVALNIKDTAQPPNSQIGQVLTVKRLHYPGFPLRINCGGGALRGFLADQVWRPDGLYGHEDGSAQTYNSHPDIANSSNDSLYWNELKGAVVYRIRVPDGRYRLILRFAENTVNVSGQRSFNIIAEDKTLVHDFDPFAHAGYRTATAIQSDSVWVNDGQLDLYFVNTKGEAFINAIELIPYQTALPGHSAASPPRFFRCEPNYPNPFNSETVFPFELKRTGNVRLQIFDVQGRLIFSRLKKNIGPGHDVFRWTARTASGIYLARLIYSDGRIFKSHTQKIVLLK